MVSQQQFDDVTAEFVNREQFEELRVRLVAYDPSKVQVRLGCNKKLRLRSVK